MGQNPSTVCPEPLMLPPNCDFRFCAVQLLVFTLTDLMLLKPITAPSRFSSKLVWQLLTLAPIVVSRKMPADESAFTVMFVMLQYVIATLSDSLTKMPAGVSRSIFKFCM